MRFDALVIGAGLSGLVDALLLAESGRRVLVLEQHTIPGGYLQQFARKKTRFDVGFHYTGSTAPGRPMRRFLEHLGVWGRLEILPLPEDAAIELRHGARRFAFPSTWAGFLEKAAAAWPAEREDLAHFRADVERVAQAFPWYSLRERPADALDMDAASASLEEYLAGRIRDPWLREVIGSQSFNLGLYPREIPWVKHALAFRANFDETCRIRGGGGALVAALVERGRELGVEYRFGAEVTAFEGDRRALTALRTRHGERHEAELFVAACPPKAVVRALGPELLSPLFREHILDMRDARGAFQVFVRLKARPQSLDATCLLLRDDADELRDPPLGPLLVTYPGAAGDGDGLRLEAMTYLSDEPFARWRELPVLKRGPEYEGLKAALAGRVLERIARHAPELSELVADVYTATPLSDQWYTKNDHGAVFGISHDVTQQGRDRPSSRLRLSNLFFTGHSIHMPGICGVFINAFHTCDAIRGDAALSNALIGR